VGGLGRGAAVLGIVALATAGATIGGCFNSGHHTNVAAGGGRLQLVIETGRTDVDGTHFLLDTATGDLWRLEARSAETARWVRVADGPDDLRELTPEDLGFPTALLEAPDDATP
jgi:hypothetical protein